jgi:hypothetical protein
MHQVRRDPESLPAELAREIMVRLERGMHRGEPQLYAIHGRYKLVIDARSSLVNHPEKGETWVVEPLRAVRGIVFCRPRLCKLNADGLHPALAEINRFLDGGKVTVLFDRNEWYKYHVPVLGAPVDEEGVRLRFDEEGLDTLLLRDSQVHWEYGSHGRYKAEGTAANGRRVQVVFYPKS